MKRIIVGTAGHIDHGKTALVRALTGVDADRLKEEKERGITIDIGFAPSLTLRVSLGFHFARDICRTRWCHLCHRSLTLIFGRTYNPLIHFRRIIAGMRFVGETSCIGFEPSVG